MKTRTMEVRALCFLSLLPWAIGVALEATLIAVDNSPWMCNGDYPPTRVQNQYECVNLICQVKTQNPENTIGLMSMACRDDDCPCVLVTPAVNQDTGPILTSLFDTNKKLMHTVQFEKAMKVGWLSLKRRMNKNQKPRIVAFVGSPLEIKDEADLIRWGKKLRKNSVAVDIINFGEAAEQNTPTLQAFVDAVCKEGNSHLLTVPQSECPAGGLSDLLFSSPILSEAAEATPSNDTPGSASAPRASSYAEYGGVNPELDPELAMAIKMSAQEEQDRIQRERKQMSQNAAASNSSATSQHAEQATRDETQTKTTEKGKGSGEEMKDSNIQETGGDDQMEEDEQALLDRALELSLRDPEQKRDGP